MDEQAVIDNIEDAVETVVPEVAEAVNAVRNNPVVLVGVAVISLAAGAAIGYKVAEKRLRTKFEALAEEEVENTRRFYESVQKHEYPTPEDAVKALIPEEDRLAEEAGAAFVDYSGNHNSVLVQREVAVSEPDVIDDEAALVAQEKAMEVVEARNVFVDGKPINDGDWDQEAEQAKRSEDHPYVISEEEFMENEQQFNQLQFTWYEGDGVMTDESDTVINNWENMIGENNLIFGHGSKDRHLVYIKNNKRGYDYEIARSKGKYVVEVLGLEDEDARTIRPRRSRGGDD